MAGTGACASTPVEATEPVPAGARVLEGTLHYTELPRTKSLEAYLGVEFELDTGGERVVLTASAKVSREALLAQRERPVHVTCVPQAAPVPRRDESYPIEPDGSPMKRPATCAVVALKASR